MRGNRCRWGHAYQRGGGCNSYQGYIYPAKNMLPLGSNYDCGASHKGAPPSRKAPLRFILVSAEGGSPGQRPKGFVAQKSVQGHFAWSGGLEYHTFTVARR